MPKPMGARPAAVCGSDNPRVVGLPGLNVECNTDPVPFFCEEMRRMQHKGWPGTNFALDNGIRHNANPLCPYCSPAPCMMWLGARANQDRRVKPEDTSV